MEKFLFIYNKYQRFFVILGGFLLNLTIGNLYTYNNMAPYLVKFMNNQSKSEVNNGNAVWIFGMGIFGMGSSITLGSYFVKKIGPSLTVLLAGWLMSITVLLMSYTLTTYLAVVALTYGFINGIGTGIVYGVTIDVSCNWLPNRKGMATGLVVAGFGLSAFLFDFIQSVFIHHNDDLLLDNIPQSYILLGCIYILLQFVGAMLLQNPPKNNDQTISSKCVTDFFDVSTDTDDVPNIKPHNVIMELDFWILWFTYSLLSACFFLIISLHKEFGLILRIPDRKDHLDLTYASSVGSLCNAIGRLFWGLIIDKFRYKYVMLFITLSLAVLLGTFYSPVWIFNVNTTLSTNLPATADNYIPPVSLEIFYFIWIILLYFIPSGMFVIFPYICSKLFGQENFVANYGLLFTAYSLGGIITSIITTTIWYDQNIKKNFNQNLHLWAFISGSVMAVLAAAVTMVYRGKSLINTLRYL